MDKTGKRSKAAGSSSIKKAHDAGKESQRGKKRKEKEGKGEKKK